MSLFSNIRSMLDGGKVNIARRFDIKSEAISGTMSKFHKAFDRDNDRIVGLKILDVEKTKTFEARFPGLKKPNEGEIARQFDHPRLVKTFETGMTTKDEPFLVMEYVAGEGMNSLVQTKNPALDGRRLELLRQAADGLAALHEAGFIHRDVCPRNFMVDAELASVKLIDFGLTVPDAPPYRQPGNRTGTPRYMAPEIVRRRSTDARLDIFAFGVTMYELFAFENPWPGCVTGKDAMLHATQAPIEILEFCPAIQPEVAELIHKCIEVEPANRPQTMRDLLVRLRQIERE